MKLENQVCTPEQSKRLKELGVNHNGSELLFDLFHGNKIVTSTNGDPYLPAFTVAELGMMFPVDFDKVGKYYTVKDIGRLVDDISKGYDVEGFSISANEFDTTETTLLPPMNGVWHTEAQARAAMLIYLLENNHITPLEVNQRLSND